MDKGNPLQRLLDGTRMLFPEHGKKQRGQKEVPFLCETTRLSGAKKHRRR